MSDQGQAKAIAMRAITRAVQIVESNRECISYVRPEDLETQSLFIPVVTVIKPSREDFHDPIAGIGILPKVPLMNKIREKAGVNLVRTDSEKRGEYVWVAHAFGERRQPDGTMLQGDASYEFDAEKRAELDALTDKIGKYATPIARRKHLLELCKFAEQRAVTGAQLALTHKLAYLPASFKTPQELLRGMIVCRVDRNLDGLLADPDMRHAVIEQALGAQARLFGPEDKSEEPTDISDAEEEEEAPPEVEPDIAQDDPLPGKPDDDTERMELVTELEECRLMSSLSLTSRRELDGLIKTPDTPIEDLRNAVGTVRKYFAQKESKNENS